MPMDTYGRIPKLDYIDRYAGRPHHLFEVVGYGLTKSGPFTEEGGDKRLKGDVKLNNSPQLSAGHVRAVVQQQGCAAPGWDVLLGLGGPTFDDTDSNLVLAVTSFGFSSTCSGVGGCTASTSPTISSSSRASGSPPQRGTA